ncbi:hypothetical protein [Nocardiopsis sp. FIRDI 009]|uniref:hypothetical protein n=1 Tax=Nocardiopsis sp. FIRDI 009 TaxID=714197 RepID=UPI000E284C76|nr:hypothetical protein [Nocardiopsis sp. FIRDI 009]
MVHESPTPVPGTPSADRADARSRGWRTLAQAAAVTALVGAATAVAELVGSDSLSLTTVATAAGTGALMALAAWAQRRMEVWRRP